MARSVRQEITISVNKQRGFLSYDPPNCHARKSDEIVWKCSDGPFAIQFFGISPIQTAEARSLGPKQVRIKVRSNAHAGTYSYACSVYAGEKVYLDASCPVIIIDYP